MRRDSFIRATTQRFIFGVLIAASNIAALNAGADEIAPELRIAIDTIKSCTDAHTGAIVRVKGKDLWDNTTDARTAAWASWACGTQRMFDAAGRCLVFIAKNTVMTPREKVPSGMIPALLYADGRPATPWAIRDIDAIGWFITACTRHAALLDGSMRTSFIDAVWPATQMSANLLADWSLGPNGAMLPSFQWALGREGNSNESLMLALAGLHAASRLAAMRGATPNPDWAAREQELVGRVLLLGQNDTPIDLDPLAAYWLKATLIEDPAPRSVGLRTLHIHCNGETRVWAALAAPASIPDSPGPQSDALAAALVIVRAARTR